MSVHEDLLNNGENNCSFTEDEVDIMCSEDGDGAYRDNSGTTSDGFVSKLDSHFLQEICLALNNIISFN